jgi:S-adenosyl-L-methionine hydrolase (adenosine-forming)
MQIITLTSDWEKQEYQPLIKGKILSFANDVNFVEINSQVKPFSILQASFFVRMAFPQFPPGTIHLLFVDSELSVNVRPLLVRSGDQIFIGPDNGILSLIFEEAPTETFEIKIMTDQLGSSFPELNIFAEVAGKLATGTPLEKLATPANRFKKAQSLQPAYHQNGISGNAIFIDSYQNVHTNIKTELFARLGKGRKFKMFIRDRLLPFCTLSERYSDVSDGDFFCIPNFAGILEIGVRKQVNGDAIFWNIGDNVTISFFD